MQEKMVQRIALIVEYDGSSFSGWQIQKKPAVPTVQEHLEQALSKIANQTISTICAGRTDAGVHACAQTVHFETSANRPLKAWIDGVNTYLPASIVVRWAGAVADDFHARFSAVKRTYRYVILNQALRSSVLANKVTWVRDTLNVELMHKAAQDLLGELDFSAYRASGCQSSTPFRFMESITVRRQGDFVVTELTANAFLLHMVRNIMGVLIEIGKQQKPVSWAKAVLETKDRTQAGLTAKPDGLYLVKAHYPDQYALPALPLGPVFLPYDNEQDKNS